MLFEASVWTMRSAVQRERRSLRSGHRLARSVPRASTLRCLAPGIAMMEAAQPGASGHGGVR